VQKRCLPSDMKVERINHYKDLFLDHLQQHDLRGHEYMYEAQQIWQQQWDIEAIDLPSTYSKALTSSISGRLWGGSQNSAKESMEAMLNGSKEYMRSAFRDLLATEKDLGLRCDRFLFYCEEAIASVNVHKLDDHRHDRAVLSVYLAFTYPQLYTLYDHGLFANMMELLEARNIPTDIEIERYQKSMKAIHTIMAKDERWLPVIKEAIGEHYVDGSLLVMIDFARFVVSTDK